MISPISNKILKIPGSFENSGNILYPTEYDTMLLKPYILLVFKRPLTGHALGIKERKKKSANKLSLNLSIHRLRKKLNFLHQFGIIKTTYLIFDVQLSMFPF